MRLYGEADKQTNEHSTMSGAGVDIRLRRQVPVTSKPPRLRLDARTSLHHQSWRHHQHDTNSLPASYRHTAHVVAGSVAGGGASASSYDNKKSCYIQTSDVCGGTKRDVNNVSRPLIHHQRQNLKNRFHLLKTLGEGTYGKVKLAVDKGSGEHVAIKYIKKTKIEDDNDLMRIRREIKILSSLRHEHIVNIREVFEKKDKIVLVLDYAQGGELYDYLNKMGKLSETEARRIFRQIVSAIHYCHQKGIVHRDLKLENIILDDEGNVKIADFGLSNYYSHNNTLKTFCGSPLYASPEIVNGRPYHGPEVDVWSLGVILYTLVYGAMPFESNNLVSLKQQISDGDYNQPSKPSDAAGLIRHMLTVAPSRRATIEDVLRHWWINFGHSHMPNHMPYSPDEEPPAPIMTPYSLAPSKSSLQSSIDPPAIIHHRNQSSISSDSDLELDFRPTRWSRRNVSLDSTGNSVSSSVASSPAPTPDSCRHTGNETIEDSPASIASGLLKLPPDVLEILKGCSSKSLAALLGKDAISSRFDSDVSGNTSPGPSHADSASVNSGDNIELEKANSFVFDSERMPKRGILKRKGKFSGSDSVIPDEMTMRPEDCVIPKSGHLPRRLPSFRDEANGIFASKHRATQLLDNNTNSFHNGSSSSSSHSGTVSHSSWLYSSTQAVKHPTQTPSPQEDLLQESAQNQAQDPYSSLEPATSVVKTDVIPSFHTAASIVLSGHTETNTVLAESIPSKPHTDAYVRTTPEDSAHHPSRDLPVDPPSRDLLAHPPSRDLLAHPPSRDLLAHPPSRDLLAHPPSKDLLADPPSKDLACPPSKDLADPPSKEHLAEPPSKEHLADPPSKEHLAEPPSKDLGKVVYRPKSILKKSSGEEAAKNRLSISSIGSNSSADILDLSYDSTDGDHFVNQVADSVSPARASTSQSILGIDEGKDQRSLSLDEGLLSVQISEGLPGLAYAGRLRSVSDACGSLDSSKYLQNQPPTDDHDFL